MIQAKILDSKPDERGRILMEVDGKTRLACMNCSTLVYHGPNLIGHIVDYCNCKESSRYQNVKVDKKFSAKMKKYKEGIIEDLKNGRHVSAIIQGYGFIYEDEYAKAYSWILQNISEIVQ